MNQNTLTIQEAAALRAGLPGPWRALQPVMLGGTGAVPSALADGPLAFDASWATGVDSGIRQRVMTQPSPYYQGSALRGYRGYMVPRKRSAQSVYLLALGVPVMGEKRKLSAEEIASVHRYRPRSMHPAHYAAIADYVVEVMLGVAPYAQRHPLRDQSIVAGYLDWCHRVMGIPLVDHEVFDREMISYYAMNIRSGAARGYQGTIRSRLLWVSDHLLPIDKRVRKLEKLSRTASSRPYRADEIARLKVWASAQPTAYQRHTCWVILTFGLGAGLAPADLATVRSQDVQETPAGVVVTAGTGERRREVLLLAEWEDYAVVLAQCVAPEAFLCRPHRGGADPHLVSVAIGNSRNKPDATRISMDLMRLTWFVRLLNAGCPIPTLVKAAGLKTVYALDRVLPFLDEIPAEQAVDALRDWGRVKKAQFRAENPEHCCQLRVQRRRLKQALGIEGLG